jgi:predicted nucleotidyltransferase
MEKIKLSVSSQELARLGKRYHIRRLAFFGSVLRDDFDPKAESLFRPLIYANFREF